MERRWFLRAGHRRLPNVPFALRGRQEQGGCRPGVGGRAQIGGGGPRQVPEGRQEAARRPQRLRPAAARNGRLRARPAHRPLTRSVSPSTRPMAHPLELKLECIFE